MPIQSDSTPRPTHGQTRRGVALAPPGFDLDVLLENAVFPMNRAELVDYARENKSGAPFLHRLEKMPEASYQSMEEFRQAFAEALDNYGVTNDADLDTDTDELEEAADWEASQDIRKIP